MMPPSLYILPLLLLIILTTGVVGGSFYDECKDKSTAVCIGSLDDAPSTGGGGGCVDSGSCEVILLVKKGEGEKYLFRLASPKRESQHVRIMVTVTTENRNFRKKGFPENLLFMEGEERGGGELENIVWIKYTALPNPACLSARHGCTPLDMAINHLIPEPPLAPIDSSDMIIFPFQTNDAKIMYSAPSYYDSLDGRGRRSDLNVHLSSDKVVLSIHHITSSWKTSRNGIKYPDSDAKLVNLVETRPFLLFHEVPTFLDPGRHGSDLTWLWILIAVVIIVLLLCLLFWFMRRRRDKAVVDGHVDVGRSSSSQPSSLRSSVPSSPTASNASPPYNPGPVGGSAGQSHGSHARSSNKDVPTSSHVPHKSHTHTAPPPPSASLSPRKSGSSKPTSSKRPLSSSSASHKKDRMMIGLSSV